jgi:hypothetical protein
MTRLWRATVVATLIDVLAVPLLAQQRLPPRFGVGLAPASAIDLSGPVDSNSPAVWSLDGSELQVFTSWGGAVQQASGATFARMGAPTPIAWFNQPLGGAWMEAVVRDRDVLYGYYHNEVPSPTCENDGKVRPRIGAARSTDQGETWQDLGVILESPEPSLCETTNEYNDGGVGDFSVMLDAQRNYLYVFYSSYSPSLGGQGVSVARMRWADRDQPVGALAVWQGLWLPARSMPTPDGASLSWVYPTGTPIYPARRSWHSADGVSDAFWGPSIHWNTYLRQYVLLLNRADSVAFDQEGIYIAFGSALDNPAGWSSPLRLMPGGSWYPQVLGLHSGSGTDRQAGHEARFFVSGHSDAVIRFERPERPPCEVGLLPCNSSNGAR